MASESTVYRRPSPRRTMRVITTFALLLAITVLAVPCALMGMGAIIELSMPGLVG